MSKTTSQGPTPDVADDLVTNDVPIVELLVSNTYDPLEALFERIRGSLNGGFGQSKIYEPVYAMMMNYINKIHHTVLCEQLTMPTVLKSCLNSILDLKKGDTNAQYAVVSIATAKIYGNLTVSDCSKEAIEAQLQVLKLRNYQLFSAHLVHKDEEGEQASRTLNYGTYIAAKKMFNAFFQAQKAEAIFDKSFLQQFSQWNLHHTIGQPIAESNIVSSSSKETVPFMNGTYSIQTGAYHATGPLSFTFGPPPEKQVYSFPQAVHSITDYIFTVLLPRNAANALLLKDKARIKGMIINYRETALHYVLQFSMMQALVMTFFQSLTTKEGFYIQISEEVLPAGIVDDFDVKFIFPTVSTPAAAIVNGGEK